MQKQLAANLKSARILSGKKVGEFADFLDVSIAMIRKIESGESAIYAHKVKKIAGFYDVSVNDLLSVGEDASEQPAKLRKELIITAEKLSEIEDDKVRRNLSDMIKNLAAK